MEPKMRTAPLEQAPAPVDDQVEARQAELDLLRERVLNVLGHGLHTPMSTVRGYAEALHADPSLATDAGFRDGLVRAARGLERLLDEALIASDVDTRIPARTPAPVELLAAVSERAAAIAPQATITAEGEPVVTGAFAPTVLDRVLDALLEDARDYGDGRITLAVSHEPPLARLAVRTHGALIEPEDLRLAFEPCYRGHEAVMRRTGGLGLGLPVARRLVERAGGSLTIQRSADGESVEAVLEVPVA